MQELTTYAYQDDLKAKLFTLMKDFAIEQREVTLASGQKSNLYIDCRQVYFRGEALYLIGELFFKELQARELSISFDACGGLAMGSIPLSNALSLAAFRRGRELPGFAVRKEVKEHGMQASIEGAKCLTKQSNVLLLEDVVTTGASSIKALTELQARGIHSSCLFALVDREQGGKENLSKMGVSLFSLFTLKDFDLCG